MTTPAATKNPLLALIDEGQSVWYDYLRRSLITSGELKRLIQEDGLRGMTSNPSIFEKAITGSSDYDEQLAELRAAGGGEPKELFERLALRDIEGAADVFRPVFDETRGRDGFVSIEVSPTLAHDTDGTIAEAERLWRALDPPNVMIKVPATPAGIPAIRTLTARGINVNVTLLFGVPAYEQVAESYIAGLEARAENGGDVAQIASVASFFVSRIDTLADALLEQRGDAGRGLQGKIAIANAKVAYERYREIFAGERWDALAARGARTQRLLWASTSAKNPKYPDIYYVEALIGPDTIDTVPPATFEAFREHGKPGPTLEDGIDEAHETLGDLAGLGISLDQITDQVLQEGVELFADAFTKLLDVVAESTASDESRIAGRPQLRLPDELASAVEATITDWAASGKTRRLWQRDPGLWTGTDESRWLGWLDIADDERRHPEALERLAADVRAAGFDHALLLGMGGSSMAPEVLSITFGPQPEHPELHVLDSTDPAQVRAMERRIDLEKTLFIVSSKSGTTLEPNIFKQYFFERVAELIGRERAGSRFIAVTDPGSKLEEVARHDGFRSVAHGLESIGGRYSALSNFGMVPTAISGVDVRALLDSASEMARACASSVPPHDNPGLVLGAVIGTAAVQGRDKVTLVASPAISDLGAWLEQLLAESTGKEGRGVVPVDREPLGPADAYGEDRLFIHVRLASEPDAGQDRALEALARAGHPVVGIEIADRSELGGQFFQWEFATAVAGSIIGINPFDQPDVEASKNETRKLTDEFERAGVLPPEKPIFETPRLKLFADDRNADELAGSSLEELLAVHLGRIGPGDYVALLAYIEMSPQHEQELTAMRRAIRDRTRAATCVGFGPRFLHSTGQVYKGGPNSGVFLQITCDDRADIPVPGQTYTFGVVKAAQARGDFQVLAERGRRALRVHLGDDVDSGLAELRKAIELALT